MQSLLFNVCSAILILLAYGKLSNAFSHLFGVWHHHSYASEELNEIAKWSVNELITNNGELLIQAKPEIRKIQTQIVYGINYRLELSVIILLHGSFKVKNCQVEVFDQPWTKTRRFNKPPTCQYEAYNDLSI